MPLTEVLGSEMKPPEQMGGTWVKVGVMPGVMVTVNNGFGLQPDDGSKYKWWSS
jgi:hypothetical protein